MDIEIRCTPKSQSAIVQLVIEGAFNYKPNRTGYPFGIYYYWYHDVFVTITENGFQPNSGKQKMFFRSKIKPDGEADTSIVFTFPVYPLHSQTEYTIDVELQLTDTSDIVHTFTAHTNFSTGIVQTGGYYNDRNEALSLKEQQKNATLLHNSLVKRGYFTLESFCCLLGLSDCAGNINPTQYMIYKGFEADVPQYNPYTSQDSWIFFGLYNWENAPLPYTQVDRQMYIPQNGINSQVRDYCGSFYLPAVSPSQYVLDTAWFYEEQFPYKEESPILYPEDYKKEIAFGVVPFIHSIGLNLLNNNGTQQQLINMLSQSEWLTIEKLVPVYIRLGNLNTSSIWNLSQYHQQEYSDLWAKYDTLKKFSKCRVSNIDKIAEFMCHCFMDGTWGSLGYDTAYYDPDLHYIYALYHIECVKKKANYWYKYFKKRRHPWWIYIKWNI